MKKKKIEKVVIVGGGSAGWMTTLILSNRFPEINFVVVAPGAIGAIGVGESVTGSVLNLVNDPTLGLRRQDFFQRADATLKLGIWFRDWQGVGTEYLAPIDNPKSYFQFPYREALEDFYAMAAADGVQLGKAQIHAHLMRSNKTDYFRKDGEIHDSLAHAACHLDALKFADWLSEVCLARPNVSHIDDTLATFEQIPDSAIVTRIVTATGQSIQGDFFVDCSGLHRLLLKEAYSPGWIDFSNHIKVDSAIPCETPYAEGETIPAFTDARAMPNGWMWRIPTQSRLGQGYLFSSRHAGDEQAVTEMRDAGVDPGESPRIIRFKPGKHSFQWKGNVCAIGLAGGFVEALESTTIHGMNAQIQLLADLFLPFYTHEAAAVMAEKYNRLVDVMYDDFVDFVSFHYHSGRADSEFWRDYQKPESITAANQQRIEMWKHAFPHREDFSPVFTTRTQLTTSIAVWMPMLCGMGYLNPLHARRHLNVSRNIEPARANLSRYISIRGMLDKHGLSQSEAIAYLKNPR